MGIVGWYHPCQYEVLGCSFLCCPRCCRSCCCCSQNCGSESCPSCRCCLCCPSSPCCYCPCSPSCWLPSPPSGPPCSQGHCTEAHLHPHHTPCDQPCSSHWCFLWSSSRGWCSCCCCCSC